MNDNISAFNSNEYDIAIKHTLPFYEEFYTQIIDIVQIYNSNSLKWLDVGCGTGKMADIAFSKAKIKKFVFCDCSVKMIQIAKNHFDFPNTEFYNCTIQELVYDDKFDIITCIQVNHYLHRNDRIIAIRKCFEFLETNGMFISFENFAPSSVLAKKLYLDRWKAYQLKQGKSSDECKKHMDRYNRDYFPIPISEHLNIMKSCGFKTVEILWLSYMQVGILGIK